MKNSNKWKSYISVVGLVVVFACNSQTTTDNSTVAVLRPTTVAETPSKQDFFSEKEASQAVMALIPKGWAQELFVFFKLDTLYAVDNFTTPAYLIGDFDGDNSEDVALLIANKKTKDKGVLILHKNKAKGFYVAGAGTKVDGMTDLSWIEIFEKIPKGETVARTLVDEESGDIIGADSLNAHILKGEGILTHVTESEGGGILFWNKNKYEWVHIE